MIVIYVSESQSDADQTPQDTPIAIISNNRNRTHSLSSMKSINSFYSVKSGDGDYYSIGSDDSFKST